MGTDSIDTVIHLVAGGAGGTMGAILTCPFEVVKTRLQSSNSGLCGPAPGEGSGTARLPSSQARNPTTTSNLVLNPAHAKATKAKTKPPSSRTIGGNGFRPNLAFNYHTAAAASLRAPNLSPIPRHPTPAETFATGNPWTCIKCIVRNEGLRGLFKGLGPNLVGVAPARAIYFWAYSTSKKNLNRALPKKNRDTPFVHVISAGMAGFTASTMTNPIWLVKTRLQLDRRVGEKSLSVRKCVSRIYNQLGISGFWRGVTASYWGISETVIHFVLYEFLKTQVALYQNKRKDAKKTIIDFAGFMLCGACSKTCATIVAYPHEVARTRLREEGQKYRSFWQTLGTVYREEGRPGLYRGLTTQLVRQIPNTAIMMATYELTVYFMTQWLKEPKVKKQEDFHHHHHHHPSRHNPHHHHHHHHSHLHSHQHITAMTTAVAGPPDQMHPHIRHKSSHSQ